MYVDRWIDWIDIYIYSILYLFDQSGVYWNLSFQPRMTFEQVTAAVPAGATSPAAVNTAKVNPTWTMVAYFVTGPH